MAESTHLGSENCIVKSFFFKKETSFMDILNDLQASIPFMGGSSTSASMLGAGALIEYFQLLYLCFLFLSLRLLIPDRTHEFKQVWNESVKMHEG